MNVDNPAEIRQLLRAKLAELQSLESAAADAAETVALDQSKVGRLSRMDALQGQAMAQATHARRRAALRAVHAAIARLDAGHYGVCEECGEPIDPRRLAHDPTVSLCIDCATRAECD